MHRRALLAGVASAAVVPLAGCTGSLFQNSVQESRSRQFDRPADAAVSVAVRNGAVGVQRADRTDVAVDAEVSVPSEDRFGDVAVTAEEVDGVLAVGVTVEGSRDGVSVDLTVRVPDGTPIATARSRNGDVSVTGVDSVATAQSENGDVTVRTAGPVRTVATKNGDVDADVPAPLAGDVSLRSENGDVDAAVSPAVDAAVAARTENGDVSVSGLELTDRDVSETRVSGTLGDGDHALTAATTNGDVSLRTLDE